jgi:DNA-binding transcriptional ArsR family regulator
MRTASAATSAGPGVDVFRAVADPTRRAILDRLRSDDLSVNDLAGPFDMTQPAVSQHLRILLDAGLVEAEQIGRQRLYRLNAQPLHEVFEWSGQYRHLFIDPVGHAWRITPRARAPRKGTRKSKWGPARK